MIREYRECDNLKWTRCRVLSFLDSAYYDNVLREKEKYENPALELVVEEGDQIIGFIDLEYDEEDKGVIWNIGVMPEHRKKGLATKLLEEAVRQAKAKGVKRIEAWTRDDEWVCRWYEKQGFVKKESYLQVFSSGNEGIGAFNTEIDKMYVCDVYGEYVGEKTEEIKKRFKRVHECSRFELEI